MINNNIKFFLSAGLIATGVYCVTDYLNDSIEKKLTGKYYFNGIEYQLRQKEIIDKYDLIDAPLTDLRLEENIVSKLLNVDRFEYCTRYTANPTILIGKRKMSEIWTCNLESKCDSDDPNSFVFSKKVRETVAYYSNPLAIASLMIGFGVMGIRREV